MTALCLDCQQATITASPSDDEHFPLCLNCKVNLKRFSTVAMDLSEYAVLDSTKSRLLELAREWSPKFYDAHFSRHKERA